MTDVEITPRKLSGTVSAPPSKSAAHRALICAALADGKSVLKINDISEDVKATIGCIEQLGAQTKFDGESITVIPPKNYPSKAEFNCGESGSTLRFMLPVAAALGIEAVFTGHGRLPERPVRELLEALQNHGIKASADFQIRISGKMTGGRFSIAGNISSQYITGLLLAFPLCGDCELEIIEPIESKPYIDMTVGIMRTFGINIENKNNKFKIKKQNYSAKDFQIEGDWSNGAALLACGATVKNLDKNSLQGDKEILGIFEKFGAEIAQKDGGFSVKKSSLSAIESDASDTPDLVPIIAALAATAERTTLIKNISRLRFKESDRVAAIVNAVNSLGGNASANENEIIIRGVKSLHGGTVSSCGDHRIVMAAAIMAQDCEDKVVIKNADAINKSYPDFFSVYNSLGGEADVMQLW